MGVFDFLFGGEARDPDWGAIERLMKLDAEINRTDRVGPFGGWVWDDNKQRQMFVPGEGMSPGISRLTDRATMGMGDPYQSPEGFSDLLAAKIANQQQRHGYGSGVPNPNAIQNAPPPQWQPPPDYNPGMELPEFMANNPTNPVGNMFGGGGSLLRKV
jgi:hypothetical protein